VTTEGSGPEGQNGTVIYASLETTDTYEAVKAFYEKQIPTGWKQVGSFESTDENGDRSFTLTTQNSDGTAWFIGSVMEQKADGKVIISHNIGTEGTASQQPADTGPLKPYPNAAVVSSSSWTGMGGNGKEGKWTAVILSTTDSYDQVKAYYQSNKPTGFDTNYSGENTDDSGARTYSAWFASADQIQFYMVGVSENKTENKIEISQTFGSGQ